MAEEVVGLREAVARIEQIRRNASNLKAPLKASADLMLGSLATNFDVGGRPPWEPLAESTRARKKSGLKLVGEGGGAHMRDANVPLFTNDGWEIGNKDWKAPFHLRGTKKDGQEHVPARNWMLYQDEDVDAIGGIFYDHLFLI